MCRGDDNLWKRRDAVKIRSQATVDNPGGLGDVVDLIDERFKRRPRELLCPLLFDKGVFRIGHRAAIGVSVLLLEGFYLGVALLHFFRIVGGLAGVLLD